MEIHLKFAFESLDDAVGFYAKAHCNHVVLAPYLEGGLENMAFYTNKPAWFTGDPEIGMEEYRTAKQYESFLEGSVETTLQEFTYLPGSVLLLRRETTS